MRSARPIRLFAAFSAFATVALAPAAPASAGEIENADQILVGTGDSQRLCTVEHPIAENAPPFGVGPCPGVRPGGRLLSDAGGCTFNFLFKGFRLDDLGKPVEVGRFMGTAGHCILGGDGEEIWPVGGGPEARDGNNQRAGEFAYAIRTPTQDFALIRLDQGIDANPQMCHFGGPTGIANPSVFPTEPRVIQHFGQGFLLRDTVSARSGLAYLTDPNYAFAATAASSGDSGSGVLTEDGRARGVLIGVSALGAVVTRFAPHVDQARQALALDSLVLQTAPQL